MKKKDESKVVAIVYFCDTLKKEIVMKDFGNNLSTSSQECEICGSHGSVTLYITNCECGKFHDIEINSW